MAEVKNYGLSGVHRTLQLGKLGPVLVGNADSESFSVTTNGTTLTNVSGANATDTAHFITKGQLDAVYTEAVFKANVNYNDSSPILLGNITAGTKTIITTLTVGTAFDDPSAVVTIGTSGNTSLLMSDDYCEIEATGVYQTINTVEITSNTALNIYVTQAGATAGAGNVLVSVVDGPVVDGGTINYGAGGSSTGNFVFNGNNLELSGGGGDDMYIKSPDDLYLDALNDDVILRANDDIRLRSGYNFITDTYDYELRFNDSAQLVFYNSSTSSDHGHILMTTDVGNSQRVLSFVGNEQVYITTDLENAAKTWKFDRDGNLILPAGGDIKDSTGTSVLGTGGIALTDISVSVAASPSGNGSLSYDNTSGAFTFTPADLSSVAGNYGNSNVVTLLSNFGSNTISTTGNVSAGNITSGAGKSVFLGNTSSSLRQLDSNASINLGGSVTLIPDTSASALNGVQIGGNGYLLGPNGSRNITLNYSANGGVGFQSNITVGTAGIGGTANIAGAVTTGVNALFAGVTNTILSNTIASFSADVNNYTQVTLQNKSSGADATADFVITANNGSDTVNYADFGIINSGYDNTTPTNSLGNIVYAADTYLYAQGNTSATSQSGGNIAIGTTVSGKTVKIFAGGANSTAIVGTFSGTAGLAITGNISATGITKTEQIHEIFTTKTSATGTVTHDCSTGQLFSHSSISANFTANFTNLNLDSGYATTTTLVLNQGGTAYIPNAVQIGGVSQTINWQGGSAPSGNANKKDVVSFSILNSSGTYTVLGQLTTFG